MATHSFKMSSLPTCARQVVGLCRRYWHLVQLVLVSQQDLCSQSSQVQINLLQGKPWSPSQIHVEKLCSFTKSAGCHFRGMVSDCSSLRAGTEERIRLTTTRAVYVSYQICNITGKCLGDFWAIFDLFIAKALIGMSGVICFLLLNSSPITTQPFPEDIAVLAAEMIYSTKR